MIELVVETALDERELDKLESRLEKYCPCVTESQASGEPCQEVDTVIGPPIIISPGPFARSR